MKKIILVIIVAVCMSNLVAQAQHKPINKTNPDEPTAMHYVPEQSELDFLKKLTPLKNQITHGKIEFAQVANQKGDKRHFWVRDRRTNTYNSTEFELVRKGSLSQVWFEVAEIQNGNLTEDIADTIFVYLESKTNQFSHDPSKGIINLSNEVFGSPPNVDGDGLTDFLITDIKDGYSPGVNDSYISGFFSGNDQYLNSDLSSTDIKSNERDILYIDSYPGIFNGSESNATEALNTLAHEYQHLIHFNYNDALGNSEYIFINEGQSTFASLLVGYFPHPAIFEYLNDTNAPLFRWDTFSYGLDDYGRAALFFSYFWEQFGFENAGTLTQSSFTGLEGINAVLAEIGSTLSFEEVLVNWGLANLLNDQGNLFSTNYKYQHPFLKNLKSSDIEYINPNIDRYTKNIHRGGFNYIDLSHGQVLNLKVKVSWAGNSGEAYLITSTDTDELEVIKLEKDFIYSTKDGVEYDDIKLLLVDTNVEPDLTIIPTFLTFTIETSAEESVSLLTDNTHGSIGSFYLPFPIKTSSNIELIGFTNKYNAPIDGIIFGLELFILNASNSANRNFIEVKGSGTMQITIREDNNGEPSTVLASKAIPFSSIDHGWQVFRFDDLNLAVTEGTTFHASYHFEVNEVDHTINSVPLKLDNGSGEQDVTFLLVNTPNEFFPMVHEEISGQDHGILNKVIYGQKIATSIVEDGIDAPQEFLLNQNYPNPFNPTTNINFSLPEASEVSLTVFNALGKKVAILVDSHLNSGSHSITWNAQNVPSGIYFYRLKAGNFVQTNKMLLLK